MPQAGQPTGVLPGLGFSNAGFLPVSTFGFSHELIAPAVTATSIAGEEFLKVLLVL